MSETNEDPEATGPMDAITDDTPLWVRPSAWDDSLWQQYFKDDKSNNLGDDSDPWWKRLGSGGPDK